MLSSYRRNPVLFASLVAPTHAKSALGLLMSTCFHPWSTSISARRVNIKPCLSWSANVFETLEGMTATAACFKLSQSTSLTFLYIK